MTKSKKTSVKKSKVTEMTPNEYIIRRIREKILLNWNDYADNLVAVRYQETVDTPEAKKQVEAGKHNMKKSEKNVAHLTGILNEFLAK